jgi:hypothetical protein
MSSQNPATPVKVPSAAANYTAATLDPDLRSQINSLLIKEGHVTKYAGLVPKSTPKASIVQRLM